LRIDVVAGVVEDIGYSGGIWALPLVVLALVVAVGSGVAALLLPRKRGLLLAGGIGIAVALLILAAVVAMRKPALPQELLLGSTVYSIGLQAPDLDAMPECQRMEDAGRDFRWPAQGSPLGHVEEVHRSDDAWRGSVSPGAGAFTVFESRQLPSETDVGEDPSVLIVAEEGSACLYEYRPLV